MRSVDAKSCYGITNVTVVIISREIRYKEKTIEMIYQINTYIITTVLLSQKICSRQEKTGFEKLEGRVPVLN